MTAVDLAAKRSSGFDRRSVATSNGALWKSFGTLAGDSSQSAATEQTQPLDWPLASPMRCLPSKTRGAAMTLDTTLDSLPMRASEACAGRAVGAMFFSGFGAAWVGAWALAQYPGLPLVLLLVGAIAAALMTMAYRTYRTNAPAMKARAKLPESLRRSRQFNAVNAGQWGLLLVAGFALSHFGQQRWILPMAILVVGLHFLPLARVFAYPPHYLTGAALVLLACGYPVLAAEGPESAVGALGAGLILWISAAWALTSAKLTSSN